MARIYDAQAATINSVALGGLTQFTVNRGYDNVGRGHLEGASGGASVIMRHGKYVRGQISSQDVLNMLALFSGTVGTGVFYMREAGAATYTKRTLKAPVIGALAFTSGRNALPAAFTADYECRWGSTDDFQAMDTWLAAQSTPTIQTPAQLDAPSVINYNPDAAGEGADISLSHIRDFNFSVAGELLRDYNTGSLGYDAVEFIPGQITGSINYADATVSGTPPADDKASKLLKSAGGVLTVTYPARGYATPGTIVLKNVLFPVDANPNPSRGFGEFSVNFELEWFKASTRYLLDNLGAAGSIIVVTAPS